MVPKFDAMQVHHEWIGSLDLAVKKRALSKEQHRIIIDPLVTPVAYGIGQSLSLSPTSDDLDADVDAFVREATRPRCKRHPCNTIDASAMNRTFRYSSSSMISFMMTEMTGRRRQKLL